MNNRNRIQIMSTKIDKKKLKGLIKESVREVIKSELAQFRDLFIPKISKEEQKEIEKHYGKPSYQVKREKNIKVES